MPNPQRQPGNGADSLRPVADERRVIEMLRQARGSVPGIEDSLAALRRRVRELEDENERLRHGPHGDAA
jgi:hypothetical protein